MPIALSLLAGLIFGAGLALADMVNPARVLNFFDVAGSWDPTLLFVMGGALLTTTVGYRLIFARGAPLFGGTFHFPSKQHIDLPLAGGAALFGVGWGIAGLCPGPALAALVSLEPKAWAFVAAMLAGMAAVKAGRVRLAFRKAP